MKTIVLGSKAYKRSKGEDPDFGDCIIIDNGDGDIAVYDCGSPEHATRVLSYMNNNGTRNAYLILSHNDSDHFGGIEKLMTDKRVKNLYTELLFKHKNAILAELDDDRRTKDSVQKALEEWEANKLQLEKWSSKLRDIYQVDTKRYATSPFYGIRFVGPDYKLMIETVAKALNESEGDSIYGESVKNAACVQLEVELDNNRILLTGDACFDAFDDKLKNYDIVQLPHHGKYETAKKVFDKEKQIVRKTPLTYFVSDNKGDAKGGSAELKQKRKGYDIHFTNEQGADGDISEVELIGSSIARGSYSPL